MHYSFFFIFAVLASCHLEVPGTGSVEAVDEAADTERAKAQPDFARAPTPGWDDTLPDAGVEAGTSATYAQDDTIEVIDSGASAPTSSGAPSSDLSGSAFTLLSPAFVNEAQLPDPFSCRGADRSPPLTWINPPPEAQSFALVLTTTRPTRPSPTVEWVVWSIPADWRALPEGMAAGREPGNAPGTRQEALSELERASRDLGVHGALPGTLAGALGLPTPLDLVRRPRYHGPCDEPGMRYQFTLFALDATASRQWGAFVSVETVTEWLSAPKGALAQARLVAGSPQSPL